MKIFSIFKKYLHFFFNYILNAFVCLELYLSVFLNKSSILSKKKITGKVTICWRKNRLRKGLGPKYIVRECKTVSIEWGLVLGHQGSMVRSFSSVIFPQESDSLWSMPVSHIEPHVCGSVGLVRETLRDTSLLSIFFCQNLYAYISILFNHR